MNKLSKQYVKTACGFIGAGVVLVGLTLYKAITTKSLDGLGVGLYSVGMMFLGAGAAAAGEASAWKKIENEFIDKEVN